MLPKKKAAPSRAAFERTPLCKPALVTLGRLGETSVVSLVGNQHLGLLVALSTLEGSHLVGRTVVGCWGRASPHKMGRAGAVRTLNRGDVGWRGRGKYGFLLSHSLLPCRREYYRTLSHRRLRLMWWPVMNDPKSVAVQSELIPRHQLSRSRHPKSATFNFE